MRRADRVNQSCVVVVGSVNIDLVLRVDRLPRAGETVAGGTFERFGGGKGANQAVAAARAGAEVHFFGAVGDDDLADLALTGLRAEGLDVSSIARIEGCATGVAAIVVDASGENQIAVASGANARLDEPMVERMLSRPSLFRDGVCLLNLELPDAAVLAAARCADAAGVRAIVVNPAPARELPAELLKLHPILTPNAGEALALGLGEPDPGSAAEALFNVTRAPVILTLGSDGALMVNDQGRRRFPAPEVQAVDATGAGDAFNGGLAAALAQGFELDAAVQRAVAAGSWSVQAPGARGGLATRQDLDSL